MIELLIVGYSGIVKKKALQGISQIPELAKIDVVSKSRAQEALQDEKITGKVFTDYDDAFENSTAKVAYVSTVNSLHAPLAKKALRSGMHVIVDKPSFLTEYETIELTNLAKEKNLCLAEATIYADHPQIIAAKDEYAKTNSSVKKISSIFSFPPFPDRTAYKYDKQLGGGAILDIGPYALTPGRVFFGTQPISIDARISRVDAETGIDMAFSMMATYPDDKIIVGHFGFDSAYKSHMTLIGEKVTIDIPVPFSPPSSLQNELVVNAENNWKTIKCEAGDNFTLYFQRVFKDILNNDYIKHIDLLLEDFNALKMLKDSIIKYD